MSNVQISFVIVNYKSASFIERAVSSLTLALKSIPHEIIIVNNDDHERFTIESLRDKYAVTVRHLGYNSGYSTANNFGATLARGEILVFLNPDTYFVSGKFESLIEAFKYHPQAIFGLRLEDEKGCSEKWSCGYIPTLWRIFLNKILFFTGFVQFPWQKSQVTHVDWVSGAALAIRKHVFESLQGFDESFFLYYEDVDLCQRVRKKGFPVISYPFLKWRHLRGRSHSSYHSMKMKYLEGQRRYFEKHGTWVEKKLIFFLQLFYRLFI